MNLNLINLSPTDWSRDDWRDAYAQYCQTNMFGPKTKKEYYDMVLARHAKFEPSTSIEPSLLATWRAGRCAAKEWAHKRGCDMNGRLLIDIARDKQERNMEDMRDDITDLQQAMRSVVKHIRRRK